jgi:hypothetical protein
VRETVLGEGVLDGAPRAFCGGFRAREHVSLTSLNRCSPILVFDESKGKVGCVSHGKICSVAAEGRHQVGCVADESDATSMIPAMADWKRIDWPWRDSFAAATRPLNELEQIL